VSFETWNCSWVLFPLVCWTVGEQDSVRPADYLPFIFFVFCQHSIYSLTQSTFFVADKNEFNHWSSHRLNVTPAWYFRLEKFKTNQMKIIELSKNSLNWNEW
jgi:hypothetical protein